MLPIMTAVLCGCGFIYCLAVTPLRTSFTYHVNYAVVLYLFVHSFDYIE